MPFRSWLSWQAMAQDSSSSDFPKWEGSKEGSPKASSGRATPKKNRKNTQQEARRTGRYTAPTPKSARQSPRWWAPVFLGLLVLGVLVILLNYLSVFGHPTGWGLLVGLVIIAAGFVMATRYR